MSILIAYKKGDTIYMGTDTRTIVNDHKKNELRGCNLKIQKLANDMLLGITGERLERQTLIAYSEIFTLDKNGKLTKKHIVKEIIPKLITVLEKEIAKEKQTNKELKQKKNQIHSDKNYKDIARNTLGIVNPGDKVYVNSNDNNSK